MDGDDDDVSDDGLRVVVELRKYRCRIQFDFGAIGVVFRIALPVLRPIIVKYFTCAEYMILLLWLKLYMVTCTICWGLGYYTTKQHAEKYILGSVTRIRYITRLMSTSFLCYDLTKTRAQRTTHNNHMVQCVGSMRMFIN